MDLTQLDIVYTTIDDAVYQLISSVPMDEYQNDNVTCVLNQIAEQRETERHPEMDTSDLLRSYGLVHVVCVVDGEERIQINL